MDRRLLEAAAEHVTVHLDPAEAAKLVRRLRGVAFFIHVEVELVTQTDEEAGTYRYFPASKNLRVSQSQALEFLKEMADTAERLLKREKGPLVGRIKVTRLGGCLFIA